MKEDYKKKKWPLLLISMIFFGIAIVVGFIFLGKHATENPGIMIGVIIAFSIWISLIFWRALGMEMEEYKYNN